MHSSPSTLSGLYVHGAMHAGVLEIEAAEQLFGFHDPYKVIRDAHDRETPAVDCYIDALSKPSTKGSIDVGFGSSYGARVILDLMARGRLRCGVLLAPAKSGIIRIPTYADVSEGVSPEWSSLLQQSATSGRSVSELKALRKGAILPLADQIQHAVDTSSSTQLLIIQSEDDPWRADIPNHAGIISHTLNGSCHFPHLSTITQDECRSIVHDWLVRIGLINNETSVPNSLKQPVTSSLIHSQPSLA